MTQCCLRPARPLTRPFTQLCHPLCHSFSLSLYYSLFTPNQYFNFHVSKKHWCLHQASNHLSVWWKIWFIPWLLYTLSSIEFDISGEISCLWYKKILTIIKLCRIIFLWSHECCFTGNSSSILTHVCLDQEELFKVSRRWIYKIYSQSHCKHHSE